MTTRTKTNERRTWMREACATLGIALALTTGVAQARGIASARADRRTARPAQPTTVIQNHKELMITDLSVVEDPIRTRWPRRLVPHTLSTRRTRTVRQPTASWTFGKLMTRLAQKVGKNPSTFVMDWLRTWEQQQVINGFTVPARTRIRQAVIDPWLQASGNNGTLRMDKAPFRLLAIVNRLDLRNAPLYGAGNAGEGRFVFGATDRNGNALAFTVIFEFKVEVSSAAGIKAWAARWHALGQRSFGEKFNQELEAITDDFAGRNRVTLGQIRTNEIALAGPWELREYVLDARGQRLAPATVKGTPDLSLRDDPTLVGLLNANAPAVMAGRYQLPDHMVGGAAPVSGVWTLSGIQSPDLRHAFAVNTCNGCHQAETGARFTHVNTRSAGQEAGLSGFLTGTTITDPDGNQRSFDDLGRRARDLQHVLRTRPFVLALEPARRSVH